MKKIKLKQKVKLQLKKWKRVGKQTFQIGTFEVGEEELDPGGQI